MTNGVSFRPCLPQDVEIAVPLIYSSGPAAFNFVFCHDSAQQAQHFLQQAFVQPKSEFSYKQHLAVLLDGEMVGLGAMRYPSQNFAFMLSAARQIFQFYSPMQALTTITRGLRIEQVIKPPRAGVGNLYHLAILPGRQGQGLGQQLIQQLLLKVKQQHLSIAGLDVADTNPAARALYERLGFTLKQSHQGGMKNQFGEVVDHHYMELPLNQ